MGYCSDDPQTVAIAPVWGLPKCMRSAQKLGGIVSVAEPKAKRQSHSVQIAPEWLYVILSFCLKKLEDAAAWNFQFSIFNFQFSIRVSVTFSIFNFAIARMRTCVFNRRHAEMLLERRREIRRMCKAYLISNLCYL